MSTRLDNYLKFKLQFKKLQIEFLRCETRFIQDDNNDSKESKLIISAK